MVTPHCYHCNHLRDWLVKFLAGDQDSTLRSQRGSPITRSVVHRDMLTNCAFKSVIVHGPYKTTKKRTFPWQSERETNVQPNIDKIPSGMLLPK
jgi:hypothetical protein